MGKFQITRSRCGWEKKNRAVQISTLHKAYCRLRSRSFKSLGCQSGWGVLHDILKKNGYFCAGNTINEAAGDAFSLSFYAEVKRATEIAYIAVFLLL